MRLREPLELPAVAPVADLVGVEVDAGQRTEAATRRNTPAGSSAMIW